MIETALLKERLEDELRVITKELQGLGIQNPQVKNDWIALPQDVGISEADENVGADRAEDWEERNATLSALELSYNNITHALQRIEVGTYDVCEICAQHIEEDRLNADPSARTCKEHMDEEIELFI